MSSVDGLLQPEDSIQSSKSSRTSPELSDPALAVLGEKQLTAADQPADHRITELEASLKKALGELDKAQAELESARNRTSDLEQENADLKEKLRAREGGSIPEHAGGPPFRGTGFSPIGEPTRMQ